jgi:hypothetical protein
MLGWLRLGDLLDLPALAQGDLERVRTTPELGFLVGRSGGLRLGITRQAAQQRWGQRWPCYQSGADGLARCVR